MGIIKATTASVSGLAADQWKEFFYCESIPADTIMVRGEKRVSSDSSNTAQSDVITDGSTIAVADGQAAIVVSSGKVISIFVEPGEHVFSSGVSPSIVGGSSLKSLLKEVGRRISYGGDAPAVVQRVYYFNTKEIPGNAFGTDVGIPFRIKDEKNNLDIDCSLIISGMFSFRVCNPERIYKLMIGNVERKYSVAYLINHVKAEVTSEIVAAVGTFSGEGMRPSSIGGRLPEIERKVVEKASEKLRENRGIELVSLAFDVFRITEKDSGIVRNIQRDAALKADPALAGATVVGGFADAMKELGEN